MKASIRLFSLFACLVFFSLKNYANHKINYPSYFYTQSEVSVRELISRTETSIYKAQKEMMAGHVERMPTQLSFAIRFQELAVTAFKNKDFNLAVCYSIKAREYSNDILIKAKLQNIQNYLLNDAEKRLADEANYLNTDLNKTKISTDTIDDVILFDPQKLRSSFIITINE